MSYYADLFGPDAADPDVTSGAPGRGPMMGLRTPWAGGTLDNPPAGQTATKYLNLNKTVHGAYGQATTIINKDTVTVSTATYEALRMRLVITGTGELYRVETTGKYYYRGGTTKSKVENIASTDKIKQLPSEFLFNETDARAFTSQLARSLKYGDFKYAWASKENIAIGSFVNIQTASPSINTMVQITKKEKLKHIPLYAYSGIGTIEFNLETILKKGEVNFSPAQLAFFIDKTVQGNTVTVAANDYYYNANYRCDGTADQVEINAAIAKLTSESSGGTVKLSPGTFYISAAIELDSNIVLIGSGASTIIEKNCNDYAIECVGSDGSEKENVQVLALKVTRNASDTNDKEFVYLNYSDSCSVLDCVFSGGYFGGVRANYCNDVIIANSRFINTRYRNVFFWYSDGKISGNSMIDLDYADGTDSFAGVFVGNTDGTNITNNTIANIYSGEGFSGIYVDSNDAGISIISDNNIRNCAGYDVNASAWGILISGDSTKQVINNNTVKNVYDYGNHGTYNPTGIYIFNGNDNKVTNNMCFDNINLIDRGSCESTTAPMVRGETANTPNNCTWARSSDLAYQGTYSYKGTKIVAAGTPADALFFSIVAGIHGLIHGLTYKASVYLYIPTGQMLGTELSLEYRYYDGSWHTTTQAATNTYDAWQLVEMEFTLIASGISNSALNIDINSAVSNNEYFYCDNVRLLPVGIGNDHAQQFVDNGTDTQENINSWQ